MINAMNGSEFLSWLPEQPCPEREDMIVEQVRSGGTLPVWWMPVQLRNYAGEVYVAHDSLRFGAEDDWVRCCVSATTAQRIADLLGCLLPNDKIADMAHEQATVRLTPHTQDISSTISCLQRHHASIEDERAGREGLISTVGKEWVVVNDLVNHPLGPTGAVNYGWHGGPYVGRGGARVWQTLGHRHNRAHVDYSQLTPRLVHPLMRLNGEVRDTAEVLTSAGWDYVAYERQTITRHPGINPEPCIITRTIVPW